MTHDSIRWEERLWQAGHRVTRQRSVILDAVCASGGHTSLSEIYLRVRKVDPTIDRSTVYRALRLYVELGVVLLAETGGNETLYEVARPDPHHHLICKICGEQWDIGSSALESMFNHVEHEHGFSVHTDHLVLFGYCRNCR
jgi:Fur family transcriptional regulator, ferric uptake regulator